MVRNEILQKSKTVFTNRTLSLKNTFYLLLGVSKICVLLVQTACYQLGLVLVGLITCEFTHLCVDELFVEDASLCLTKYLTALYLS